jgi:hypothetical protein
MNCEIASGVAAHALAHTRSRVMAPMSPQASFHPFAGSGNRRRVVRAYIVKVACNAKVGEDTRKCVGVDGSTDTMTGADDPTFVAIAIVNFAARSVALEMSPRVRSADTIAAWSDHLKYTLALTSAITLRHVCEHVNESMYALLPSGSSIGVIKEK